MTVSVFICTYNRGELINDTLKSLIINQTVIPNQIVVVNGGGEKNCQKTLEKWGQVFPNLLIIKTNNKNLAASRNIGMPHCSSDIILQTDDDARPYPDWVEKNIKMHEKYKGAGVIGGPVIDSDGLSLLSQIADVSTFPKFKEIIEVRNVPGVNSSYKRAVINQVGEYDENLFRGEDVDYNWRAIRKGWKLLHIPELKVIHVHRPTWRGLLYQHFMYGCAYYLVRKKWPQMYCLYPHSMDSFKDIIKLLYFFVVPFIDGFKKALKMPNLFRIILAFPMITLINYTFTLGLIKQIYIEKNK